MRITPFLCSLRPTIQCFKGNTFTTLSVSPGAPEHATDFGLGILDDTLVPIDTNSEEERAMIYIFASPCIFPYDGVVVAIERLLNIAKNVFSFFLYPSIVITG
jgi:hypothetical protein